MRTRAVPLLVLLALAGCSRPGSPPGSEPTSSPPTAAEPPPRGAVGPPEELAKLQGTWTGTVLSGDAPTPTTVEFTPEEVRITTSGVTRSRPYTVDPSKSPKWIDFEGSLKSDPPQPTTLGIYELSGDQLRIVLGTPLTRPTALVGAKEVTTAVYLLKRN